MGSAEIQGVLWGAAAQDWAEIAEPLHIPYFEAAFDAIGLGSGMHLFDARCGAGLTLATSRGATSTGLDASAGRLSQSWAAAALAHAAGSPVRSTPSSSRHAGRSLSDPKYACKSNRDPATR